MTNEHQVLLINQPQSDETAENKMDTVTKLKNWFSQGYFCVYCAMCCILSTPLCLILALGTFMLVECYALGHKSVCNFTGDDFPYVPPE